MYSRTLLSGQHALEAGELKEITHFVVKLSLATQNLFSCL